VGEQEGTVHLKMDSISAHFQGRWNDAKDELKGEWNQLGAVFPLVLKRVNSEGR
jgi:hypothetical protein